MVTPLTVMFQAFKTKLKIKLKIKPSNTHNDLKCSAINLIFALTQVIQYGVNLTNPTNLLDKIKFNLEHHKPLPFNHLITQLVQDF